MAEGSDFQNYTVHLYKGSTHTPGEEEVSIWYEIIVHGLPNDERKSWLNQSVSASPWVGACELTNLVGFYMDHGHTRDEAPATSDSETDNGTGGGTDTTGSGYEDQITTVDTNAVNPTWYGQEGIEKYNFYLGKQTSANETQWEFPLSSNGWDAEFVQTGRTKFWDVKQAEEDDGDAESGSKETFTYVNGDRVLVDYEDCYTNPSEPGWYRQTALSEVYWIDETKTAPEDQVSGAPDNQNYAPVTYSHWVYICDCGSYDAAVDQLGPPPEMNGSKVANPSEFKPFYVNESDATPTETQSGTDTPTETTVMETTTQETTTTQEETTTTMAETTTTTEADGADTPTEEDGGSGGGGPGFGIGVAVVALLGAALLALRRRD